MGYERITYALRESEVSDIGELNDEAVQRLVSACSAALREAFPGAEIEVSVRQEVGESETLTFTPVVSSGDKDLAERVLEEAWVKWSDSLSDEDMSWTLQ